MTDNFSTVVRSGFTSLAERNFWVDSLQNVLRGFVEDRKAIERSAKWRLNLVLTTLILEASN